MIKGIIFDLDGTLVDSRLDFDLIRRDLGFAPHELILEKVDSLINENEKIKCHEIIQKHELNSAMLATAIDGVDGLLRYLDENYILRAIQTRNYRQATVEMLTRLNLNFQTIFTRDDGPCKPNPEVALKIAESWNLLPSEILFVGDYLFDIETGKNAGMKTALYAPSDLPDYHHLADFVFSHYNELLAKLKE